MNIKMTTLAALILGVLVFDIPRAAAQTSQPPDTTATRPAKTTPAQTSIPNASPSATTTQTTGESHQDATVRKMNQDEKQKVETTGK